MQMNAFTFILSNINHVRVMIQEINQTRDIYNHHYDSLVLDYFQSQVYEILFVLDIVTVTVKSTATKLNHVQDILNFVNEEEILELPILLPPEIIVTVLSLDPIPKIDNFLEFTNLCIDLHRDHVQDLHLNKVDLSLLLNEVPKKL